MTDLLLLVMQVGSLGLAVTAPARRVTPVSIKALGPELKSPPSKKRDPLPFAAFAYPLENGTVGACKS